MKDLTHKLDRVLTLLEDAQIEGDWNIVSKVINELEEMYEQSERDETDLDFFYES